MSDRFEIGRAYVVFRLPDGRLARVSAGGIIGRSAKAELYLPDPRVSEAHAMVSLRGHRLKLLQLRRPIVIDGESFAQVTLKTGQRITLTRTITITVEHVQLPSHELVLCGVIEQPIPLSEERYAIVPAGCAEKLERELKHARGPKLELWYTHADGALASIWSCADGWALSVADCEPDLVRPNSRWIIGGELIRFLLHPRKSSVEPTEIQTINSPKLSLHVNGYRVEFSRDGTPVCSFIEVNGRILREIVRAHADGGSAYWVDVVNAVYGEVNEASYDRRQNSFYKQLQRIRRTLKAHGIPGRIVQTNGRGEYGLDGDLVTSIEIRG